MGRKGLREVRLSLSESTERLFTQTELRGGARRVSDIVGALEVSERAHVIAFSSQVVSHADQALRLIGLGARGGGGHAP